MTEYHLGRNCCNQVMRETRQHWQITAIDPDELRSERVCCWLSKMSAGHKHHTKWFRIMTSRVVQEVGKTTRKSQ